MMMGSMLISARSKKNKVMRFLLFFLGIMIGAFIVILILYPILGDTINYIQDLKKELKDMEKMEDEDVFAGEVEKQELPEVIEENGLVYHLAEDGCYYPDLTFEQETDYPIGKYGLIRAEYMWEHRAHEYRMMLQDGTWNRYLHEVDEECHREVEQAVRRIMEKESVDERLKAENPMEWVRRVNGIKANVEGEVERRLLQ